MSYKRIPPGGSLLVPVGDRRDAGAALAMYPACRWRAGAVQRMARAAVALLGARALPAPEEDWTPPLDRETWEAVLAEVREVVGPHTGMAVHLRRPLGRDGVTIQLLRSGESLAVLKLRRTPGRAIDVEEQALGLLAADPPQSFRAPEVLSSGERGGWRHLLLTPVTRGMHRVPGRAPFREIVDEVRDRLDGLDRPEGTPEDWVPIHGDFTPWNLRRSRTGLVLLDWEEASWGPAGADLAWYDLNVTASRLATPTTGATHPADLYGYWLDRVRRKPVEDAPTPEVMRQLRRLAGRDR